MFLNPIVQFSGNTSAPRTVACHVPQDSVLGPQLFSIYQSSLAELSRSVNIKTLVYADYCQLYLTFRPQRDERDILLSLESCFASVKSCIVENFLEIYNDKTEFMVFGTKR